MDPEKVIRFFGGVTATAEALKMSRMGVYKWRYAKAVPRVRQYQIAALSGGKFRVV